ncbi:hypothetical protein [Pseudorhodoferax sp.]|uniref:hypothetical protein n=1 Tax=Pseudorhodoferax sp. TaxID=1993553 RepID=UPI002DD6819F|nr:hypothetical protein [Pseudorhodoferax sp.]
MRSILALACSALLLLPAAAPAQRTPKLSVDREAYMARCTAQLYPLDETLLNRLAKGDGFSPMAMGYLRATRDVCGCGFEQAQMALNSRRLLLFAYRGFEPIDEGVGQLFEPADRDAVGKFEKEHKGYRQCAENFARRVQEVSGGGK